MYTLPSARSDAAPQRSPETAQEICVDAEVHFVFAQARTPLRTLRRSATARVRGTCWRSTWLAHLR